MSHLLHRHHFIINDGSGVHHLKEKSAVAGYRFERQRFEDGVLSCEEEEVGGRVCVCACVCVCVCVRARALCGATEV